MNQFNTIETGKIGEEIARKFLEKQGYDIIEQNYRTKCAEIDLIARMKNELIFVEVRTKIGENFGTPEETINKKKMKKIRFNAAAYAFVKKWPGLFRIDAVCIVLRPDFGLERLTHYQDIA